MQTVILDARTPEFVAEASRLLATGELVAFPTDTVYGVGASVTSEEAIGKLYVVKERSLDKGIPILLAEASDVDLVAKDISELARTLMAHYWPGPLTIIVPRRPEMPTVVAPGDGVAVRVPDHDLTRRLIRAAGGAVAATSANLSGQRPALNAAEAFTALGGRIAAVLDGGPVHVGQASTIVDCTVYPPVVIRQGPISEAALSGWVTNVS